MRSMMLIRPDARRLAWLLVVAAPVFGCGALDQATLADAAHASTKSQRVEAQRDGEDVVLDYAVGDYTLGEVVLDGSIYTTITHSGPVRTDKWGFAELPYVGIPVQLPEDANARIEVELDAYDDIELAHPIKPSRGVIYRNEDPRDIPHVIAPTSLVDAWYPDTLAAARRPYIFRDVRGVSVFVYPFQYNAQTQTLRVHRELRLRIAPDRSTEPTNPIGRARTPVSRTMDRIYRTVFVNYQPSNQTLIDEDGEMLVIYTPKFATEIQPYIAWKREKGFVVHEEQVPAGTHVGDTIKDAYASNNRLLYVQLVGDWEEIKSDVVSDGAADPELGCVAGSDKVPDLIVGRFVAEDASQLLAQTNKSVAYELDPELGGSWYTRGIGIASGDGAGEGDDGEADYEHVANIKDYRLLLTTYTDVAEAYRSVSNSSLRSEFNRGASVVNYTGHGNEGAWETGSYRASDAASATNGARLPIVFSTACVVGRFNGRSRTLAEGLLQNPDGGAVAGVFSSIYQPWQPPMRGQDYMNDLLVGGHDYSLHPGRGTSTSEGRTTFGSIIFNALALMYAESNGSGDLETIRTWVVFGDASLQVRTAEPRPIALSSTVLSVDAPYSTTVTSQGEPVAGAWVALSQGDVVVSGHTDSAGEVAVNHEFTSGEIALVVTGFNLATIREVLQVQPSIRITEVLLEGRAADADEILLLNAGAEVNQVAGDGTWTLTLPVQDSAASVDVTVSDTSGNTAGRRWLLRPTP